MSLYKLVQYLRDYVNLQSIQALVEIKLQTAQRSLHKLGFEYKDIKKDVFVDIHEQPDKVKDRE